MVDGQAGIFRVKKWHLVAVDEASMLGRWLPTKAVDSSELALAGIRRLPVKLVDPDVDAVLDALRHLERLVLVLGVAVDDVAQREARRLGRLEHVRRVLAGLAAWELA